MANNAPEMGSTTRRMFIEGEFTDDEGIRMAARRLMVELDNEAAKVGMAVVGDVEISASKPSLFAVPRTMRLEADVVTR